MHNAREHAPGKAVCWRRRVGRHSSSHRPPRAVSVGSALLSGPKEGGTEPRRSLSDATAPALSRAKVANSVALLTSGGDSVDNFFSQQKRVSGADDVRLYELSADVLHWLGTQQWL